MGGWANKQQRASQVRIHQGSQHIKTPSITSKVLFKKSAITHHSIPSINTPTKPSSNPSSHPPGGAHLGRANAPAAALGPGRSEDQARQDGTILHDCHGTKKVVILSCQKMRTPLAYEGKISLAMRNQTIQRTKIEFAEGWQTRGT